MVEVPAARVKRIPPSESPHLWAVARSKPLSVIKNEVPAVISLNATKQTSSVLPVPSTCVFTATIARSPGPNSVDVFGVAQTSEPSDHSVPFLTNILKQKLVP